MQITRFVLERLPQHAHNKSIKTKIIKFHNIAKENLLCSMALQRSNIDIGIGIWVCVSVCA